MKVNLPSRVPGRRDALVVLEVELSSKARRVRVAASDGLEALDLQAERRGGLYDVAPTLSRLHVPLRVTRDGGGTAKVDVTLEDAAGVESRETWSGTTILETPAEKRVPWRALVLVGVFAAIAAAIVLKVMGPTLEDSKVPALVGKRRDEAERLVKARGFAPVTASVDARTDADVDMVMGQMPPEGRSAPRSSTVVLSVGRRPDPMSPSLPSGEPREDDPPTHPSDNLAGSTTERSGGSPATGSPVAPTTMPTEPAAAAPLANGEPQVAGGDPSAGAKPAPPSVEGGIEVPALEGKLLSDAETALAGTGLLLETNPKDAADDLEGKILVQRPAAGSRAAPGSKLVLEVGRKRAAGLVEVPDTVGSTRAEAETAIVAKRLASMVVEEEADEARVGKVLRQFPEGGTKVAEGSVVEIAIGKIAVPAAIAEIPHVLGRTQAEAEKALADAGFLALVEAADAAAGAPGVVLAQDPLPGTARKGSTVTLRVVSPAKAVPAARATSDPVPEPSATPENPGSPDGPVPVPAMPTSASADAPAGGPAGSVVQAPDVLGMDRGRAADLVRKMGLAWRVTYRDVESLTTPGVVVRQVPSAGEAVTNQCIDLVVARPASASTIPTAPTPAAPAPAVPTPATAAAGAWLADDVDFAGVQTLLADLKRKASGSPHGAFWTKPYEAFVDLEFALTTSDGKVKLLEKGKGDASNLVRALEGRPLFVVLPDGTTKEETFSIMPPKGAPMPPADIARIRRWIDHGAPKDRPAGSAAPTAAPEPPVPTSVPSPEPVAPSPAATRVPDLRAKTPAEAIEAALRAGLKPFVVAESGAGRAAGKILRQSLEVGSASKSGDKVVLVLATGTSPEVVDVPDVTGLTINEAILKVAQAGLTPQISRLHLSSASKDDADRVAAQSAVGSFSREEASPVWLFVLVP